MAHDQTQQPRRVWAAAGIAGAALVLTFGAAAPTFAGQGGGHNPPGNNGTVKIHDDANDPSHHNVPHVSCDFFVDFWGFDNGQTLTVSFAGQAPTGKDTPVSFDASNGTSITSPDDAGGGNDFDGELGFTPTQEQLSTLGDPQPQQGYHVKLTVSTGEPGGHKYKVFWIQPCQTQSGGTEQGGGTQQGGTVQSPPKTTPKTAPKTTPKTSQKSTPTTVLGTHLTRRAPSAKTPDTTQVLGTSLTRTPSALPFTGAYVGAMTFAGAAALGSGMMLLLAGRRRRRRRTTS